MRLLRAASWPLLAARGLRRARRRGPGAPGHARPGRLRPGEGRRRPAPSELPVPPVHARRAPAVARALDAGAIGVVDIAGDGRRRARRRSTPPSDSTLEGCTGRAGATAAPRAQGELRMLVVPADVRERRRRASVPARIDALRRQDAATGGATSTAARCGSTRRTRPRASSRRPTCGRPVEAAVGPSPARTGAVAAQRARRARDQLAAPAAGPRVDGLHQLAGEPVGVGRDRSPPRRACSCPSTPGRRASRSTRTSGRLPSAALTGPVIQLLVAVARRDDEADGPHDARQRDRRPGRSGSCGRRAPGARRRRTRCRASGS